MSDFEVVFRQILLQLVVVIAAARLGGWAFLSIGQPRVVGEIAVGLLLGPSLLGRLAPEFSALLFPAEAALVFRSLSELSLVLLMFLIGMEFDFSHLRSVGKVAAGVAASGILLPFGLGLGLAWAIHPLVASEVHRLGFMLIVGVALSITAIPILGRIMIELGIHRTRLGTLTITAAAIDDALGWILLASVSAAIHGGFDALAVARMLAFTAAFVAVCVFAVQVIFRSGAEQFLIRKDGELSATGLSCILIGVLLAAAATNAIGVFSIFGPFVLGAALSDRVRLHAAVKQRMNDFVYAFFLPIFFTYTGLRTDVGALTSVRDWAIAATLLAVAVAGKVLGCGLAARWGGFSWRESGCVAVMMNTRALMGLVAVNVGRDLGVVPDAVFCMLVLVALATTIVTMPVLRRLLPPVEELA